MLLPLQFHLDWLFTPKATDPSDNNRWDIKRSISAIVVTAIAGEWLRVVECWTFFSQWSQRTTAIVAIIWKPGLIYRNNHNPPYLLNCYLYALQTYRTHSSKLRLLLVYTVLIFPMEQSNMQTADWLKTIVFRVRKQCEYCCHVLICMVKTIVRSLRFTLTVFPIVDFF